MSGFEDDFFKESRERSDRIFITFISISGVVAAISIIIILYAFYRVFVQKRPFRQSKLHQRVQRISCIKMALSKWFYHSDRSQNGAVYGYNYAYQPPGAGFVQPGGPQPAFTTTTSGVGGNAPASTIHGGEKYAGGGEDPRTTRNPQFEPPHGPNIPPPAYDEAVK